jgi:hypothetical protein
MKKGARRILSTLFAGATASIAIAGCSSSDAARSGNPARGESTDSTAQAVVNGLPDCNNPKTDHSKFMALAHSPGVGAGTYWSHTGRDPNPWSTTDLPKAYEFELWDNVWQSNGYLYQVKLLSTTVWTNKIGNVFLGTGIGAQGHGYLDSPPPNVPWPTYDGTFYGPTAHDYNAEVADFTSPPSNANYPVEADAWSCVTIVDPYGNPIDFFVLMDTHDPTQPPW